MICRPYKEAKRHHVTRGYSATHRAVDFGFRYGTFLVAPETCKIRKIVTPDNFDETTDDLNRGYGIFMESIEDPKKGHSYWHCLPIFPVEVGQIVRRGQIVAQMGNSGFVLSNGEPVPVEIRTKEPYLGTHLHWSMNIDWPKPEGLVNPLPEIEWDIPIEYDMLTAVRNIVNKIINLLKGR